MGKEEILTIRGKFGLSQGDLARLLGVSVVSVWKWEHEKSNPGGKAKRGLNALKNMPEEEVRKILTNQPVVSR